MGTMGLRLSFQGKHEAVLWPLMGVSMPPEMTVEGRSCPGNKGHRLAVFPNAPRSGWHTCCTPTAHKLPFKCWVSLGLAEVRLCCSPAARETLLVGESGESVRPGGGRKGKRRQFLPHNKPCVPDFTLICSLWQLCPL